MKTVTKTQLISLIDDAKNKVLVYENGLWGWFKGVKTASKKSLKGEKRQLVEDAAAQLTAIMTEVTERDVKLGHEINEAETKDYLNRIENVIVTLQTLNIKKEDEFDKHHRSFKQNVDAGQGYFQAWWNKTFLPSDVNTDAEAAAEAVVQFKKAVEIIPPPTSWFFKPKPPEVNPAANISTASSSYSSLKV